MSKNPESRLTSRIKKALRAHHPQGLFLKIHGNEFQHIGIPDLLCCVEGVFIGIEIKMPGKKPSEHQKLMILRIKEAGGYAGVAHSPEQALKIIRTALRRR